MKIVFCSLTLFFFLANIKLTIAQGKFSQEKDFHKREERHSFQKTFLDKRRKKLFPFEYLQSPLEEKKKI